MRYIAMFEDTGPMAEVRRQIEPAHLGYLTQHRDEIKMAGGLRDVPGGAYVGGLWVFEVASRERAVALIEADPYFQVHPRPYRLHVWGKALPQFDVVM